MSIPPERTAGRTGKTRVLLIEHDRTLTRALQRGLEDEDFVVTVAGDCRYAATETERHDVVVLDSRFPGSADYDPVHRKPVLLLTDPGIATDHLVADDRLGKPFGFEELLARLLALTCRGAARG